MLQRPHWKYNVLLSPIFFKVHVASFMIIHTCTCIYSSFPLIAMDTSSPSCINKKFLTGELLCFLVRGSSSCIIHSLIAKDLCPSAVLCLLCPLREELLYCSNSSEAQIIWASLEFDVLTRIL